MATLQGTVKLFNVAFGFRPIHETCYDEGGETLAQVAQRDGRCPIPGNIQGQVGWGSAQPVQW